MIRKHLCVLLGTFALLGTGMAGKKSPAPQKFQAYMTLGQVDPATGAVAVLSESGRFAAVRFSPTTKVVRFGKLFAPDEMGIGREFRCMGNWDNVHWNCFNASVVIVGNRVGAAVFDQKLILAGQRLAEAAPAQAGSKTPPRQQPSPVKAPTRKAPEAVTKKEAAPDLERIANNFVALFQQKGIPGIQQYLDPGMKSQMARLPEKIRNAKLTKADGDPKVPGTGHAAFTCEFFLAGGWHPGQLEVYVGTRGIQLAVH